MYSVEYLLKNSNLPGPRGNLELLYAFAQSASAASVATCLEYIQPDTANSPQEFAGMCGIVGFAALHRQEVPNLVEFLREYASHASWRIREAVAIALQEVSVQQIGLVIANLKPWIAGNHYEQRAVIAALAEPKLLKNPEINCQILDIFAKITAGFQSEHKLTDAEIALRKALGYGWSVVVAASPQVGKPAFEQLFNHPGKQIGWIIKSNLSKNRLLKMDAVWVAHCQAQLAQSGR